MYLRKLALVSGGLILLVLPRAVFGQTEDTGARADNILAAARRELAKGQACLQAGDVECARREFDQAVDYILEQRIDLRSDPKLRAGFLEIVQTVYRYETQPPAGGTASLFKSQEFEGRPAPDEIADDGGSDATFGPLSPVEFQRRFALLRAAFQEKYERDITLTGADHEEHRRLYGSGSAYDIRVRDLTREQVAFILSKGSQLGLRIKDFSTWDRVAAHNSRSARLGRPYDTYATGIHLHIDRMGTTRTPSMVESPAVAKPHLSPTGPQGAPAETRKN
jgi:hypothetical protein